MDTEIIFIPIQSLLKNAAALLLQYEPEAMKLRNKDQQDTPFSLIYFINHSLHVSNRLTIHHQEVALLYMQHAVFSMHLLRYMVNTARCIYNKATS
jgi:hypothetical protein